MKRIFLILTTFPLLVVCGQDTKKKAKPNRISIGLNFSPDYSYRTLKNVAGRPDGDLVIKVRNGDEAGKFGYTTGLNVCINLTKRTGFETGIQYSNKGYQTKTHDLVYPQPDPTLPAKAKYIYNYSYIDIPLKIKFVLGKNKIRFTTGAGLTVNFLVKEFQKNIYEYSNGTTVKKTQPSTFDFNKINLSPTISAGLECKINDKMYLKAEPTLRYAVFKNIDQPVTECLWSAGLNIGFYYSLK
jgi:hypothetical protein